MPELTWAKPKREEDKGKDFVIVKDRYEAYLNLGQTHSIKLSFRKGAIKREMIKILNYEPLNEEIDKIVEYFITRITVSSMQEAFKAGVQFGMAYAIEKEKGNI